jgi:hypothetical protein
MDNFRIAEGRNRDLKEPSVEDEEEICDMLKTIHLPKNLNQLSNILPKSNYQESQRSVESVCDDLNQAQVLTGN